MKFDVYGIAIVPVFQTVEAPSADEVEEKIDPKEWECSTFYKLGDNLTGEQLDLLNRFIDTLQIQTTGFSEQD